MVDQRKDLLATNALGRALMAPMLDDPSNGDNLARWSAHNVRFHRAGTKRIHHPDVGDLEFTFEGLELPDQPGWTIYAYTTAAGSPTEERVRLLGSLAATRTHEAPSSTADGRDQ